MDMGVNGNKVILMPIPVPEIEPLRNTKRHYKELFGVEGKKVLTVFGFLNTRKGYELVLDAIQDLDDCVFLIAGGTHPQRQDRLCGTPHEQDPGDASLSNVQRYWGICLNRRSQTLWEQQTSYLPLSMTCRAQHLSVLALRTAKPSSVRI